MTRSQDAARTISEGLLERTGRGLKEGDFEAFAACFALPQWMDTLDGRRMIETREDLCDFFENVRAFFHNAGVTDLVRHCVEASFQDENTVTATHKSRLLRGVTLVQEPYPCYSILKVIDGRWQITFSQYAIQDSTEHNKALMGQ